MDEPAISRALSAGRRATRRRIDAMTADFEGVVSASAATMGDDEHDREGSTIAYERAQVAGLLGEAQAYLGDLDRAMARLAAGTHAVCESCGGTIASERLVARPAARTCIGCASSACRSKPRPTGR